MLECVKACFVTSLVSDKGESLFVHWFQIRERVNLGI
jgi:hypothetical protein